MATKGERTREHILATAESLILRGGYSATSIEQIVAECDITKGGFFYHFDGKLDLARHLIRRYLEQDERFFALLRGQAEELTEDPLQRLLIFLKLLAKAMEDVQGAHPGCLVASFTYESHQLDAEVRELNADGLRAWRRIFSELVEAAAALHPMRIHRPSEELADLLTSVLEGGIMMSRCLDDPHLLSKQLLQFRDYVRLVFGQS